MRAENLPFYMDIGLTAIKLGEEARVDLKRFDLEAKGKEMKDLRYTQPRDPGRPVPGSLRGGPGADGRTESHLRCLVDR